MNNLHNEQSVDYEHCETLDWGSEKMLKFRFGIFHLEFEIWDVGAGIWDLRLFKIRLETRDSDLELQICILDLGFLMSNLEFQSLE